MFYVLSFINHNAGTWQQSTLLHTSLLPHKSSYISLCCMIAWYFIIVIGNCRTCHQIHLSQNDTLICNLQGGMRHYCNNSYITITNIFSIGLPTSQNLLIIQRVQYNTVRNAASDTLSLCSIFSIALLQKLWAESQNIFETNPNNLSGNRVAWWESAVDSVSTKSRQK